MVEAIHHDPVELRQRPDMTDDHARQPFDRRLVAQLRQKGRHRRGGPVRFLRCRLPLDDDRLARAVDRQIEPAVTAGCLMIVEPPHDRAFTHELQFAAQVVDETGAEQIGQGGAQRLLGLNTEP